MALELLAAARWHARDRIGALAAGDDPEAGRAAPSALPLPVRATRPSPWVVALVVALATRLGVS